MPGKFGGQVVTIFHSNRLSDGTVPVLTGFLAQAARANAPAPAPAINARRFTATSGQQGTRHLSLRHSRFQLRTPAAAITGDAPELIALSRLSPRKCSGATLALALSR